MPTPKAIAGLIPERRRSLLEELNAAYAEIRKRPADWADVVREREAWETTLGDGLLPEEL